MQNIRTASEISFGINLNEQAVHVIEFLKTVNDIPELNQSSILKRAVYRYEKYWLPLTADYPKEFLAPPLDVEWAWHCHMLNPNAYERDCREIVGSTVKHTMLGARRFYKEQRKSQRYWLEKFGKYDEPFSIEYREPFETVAIDTYHSKITYDILAASKRQMDLYYQVSLPHYKDRKYLNTSHQRYKQFLYAKAKLPNAFLEPSYDIDLFWHAHQLNPVIYKEDVTRIVGYFLNHGASIDHRTEEDRLNADKQSRDTWSSLYNETMPIFGAMYRGSQPAGLLYKTEKTEYCQSFMQRTKLVFDNVTISMPRIMRAVTLSLWSLADKTRAEHVFSLEYQTISRLQNITMKWKNVGQYVFKTSTDCKMLIMLEAPVGLGLKTVMASNIVNLLPWLENSRKLGSDRHIDVPVSLGHNIRLDLTISIKQLGFDQAMLTLEPGIYKPSNIPQNHKQFLGPIGLEQYPRGIDNYCEVASHRLRNHLGNEVFHVRTIQSRPLMMSVIQVFYQNKMSAIAHIIGSDHLPLPSQVDKDEITLNPLQGERAILLKNNGGDWGIIAGRWGGDQQERTIGDYIHGALFLRFFKFSTGQTTTFQVKRKMGNDYTCAIESAEINFNKGTINIKSEGNEISENIALAFSISLLYVLCVPMMKRKYDYREMKTEFILPTFGPKAKKTHIPFADTAFINAAGFLQKTPSNDYMHSFKRTRICQMCSWGCHLEFDDTVYRKALNGNKESDRSSSIWRRSTAGQRSTMML